jgi:hypothetical protein
MADSVSQNAPPSAATDAVLVKSEAMPKDAQKVEELDFNKIRGPVSADDLLVGMRYMGFQASSIAEAIRIINDMVKKSCIPTTPWSMLTSRGRGRGMTPTLGTRPQFFWVTHPILYLLAFEGCSGGS